MVSENGAGVCVVGNLNMDLLIGGVTQLPQWGQEIVGNKHHLFPAGQAGYLALGLAKLGTPTSVIGVVGDDPEGHHIVAALLESGADVHGVSIVPGEQTGMTVALVRPDGERAFASNVGCSGRFDGTMLWEAAKSLGSANLVALVGLFMVSGLDLLEARDFLAGCRREGRLTMLDTGWDPDNWQPDTLNRLSELLAEVDFFIPNLDEAQAITGMNEPIQALLALRDLCPGTIVVKCGVEGSLTWHNGHVLAHPSVPTEVSSAVGAGDVFDAGLISALQRGVSMDQALSLAHCTASIYVSRPVNRYPTRDEVDALFVSHRTTSK